MKCVLLRIKHENENEVTKKLREINNLKLEIENNTDTKYTFIKISSSDVLAFVNARKVLDKINIPMEVPYKEVY